MEESILVSTRKLAGVAPNDESFDLDILTHINSAFFTLRQLGVGPEEGFLVEDKSATWDEFTDDVSMLNGVKPYVYLRVRLAFDPPERPHHINAIKDQITEMEHRLKYEREVTAWIP